MHKFVIKVGCIIINKERIPIEIGHAKIIAIKRRIKGKHIFNIKASIYDKGKHLR